MTEAGDEAGAVSRQTRGVRSSNGPRGEPSSVSRETGDRAAAAAADEWASGSGAGSVSRETHPPRGPRPGPLTRVVLAPILLYRRLLSPLLGARCRYWPSCSAYAEEAVRTLGPARGIIVAAWRVLRCNPLSPGGLDPLENRRLFRPRPDAEPPGTASTPSSR